MADFMGKKISVAKLEKERFRNRRTINRFRGTVRLAQPVETAQPSIRDVEFMLRRWRERLPERLPESPSVEFPEWMLELARRVEDERER